MIQILTGIQNTSAALDAEHTRLIDKAAKDGIAPTFDAKS